MPAAGEAASHIASLANLKQAKTAPTILALWTRLAAGARERIAEVDAGTRVTVRTDLSQMMMQTTALFSAIVIEVPTTPAVCPTRMQRILALAPLSRRQWGDVFSVSHAAIQKWASGDEPAREELDTVLTLLQRASVEHGDLRAWLAAPVGRSSVTPLELLREKRWRAFIGAVHTRRAPKPEVSSAELLRLRKEQLPWAVPEPTPTSDES